MVQSFVSRTRIDDGSSHEKTRRNQLFSMDQNRCNQRGRNGIARLRVLTRNTIMEADRKARTGRNLDLGHCSMPSQSSRKKKAKSTDHTSIGTVESDRPKLW